MTRKIYEDPGFELSRQEIKEIIAAYYDAIKKLAIFPSINQTRFSKIIFRLRRFLPLRESAAGAAAIFALAGLIIFLDATRIGENIARAAISVAAFLVFKVLIVVAIIALLAGIWKIRQGKN